MCLVLSIIIPVTVPTGTDTDTEMALSRFGTVWTVLRALRAHDERLADNLDTAHRLHARHPHRHNWTPPRIEFILPDGIAVDPIRLEMVTKTSPEWERYFGLLEEYAERTNGGLLRRNHVEQGLPLGEWVEQQREARRRGRLAVSRCHRLERIRGWSWHRDESVWQATYALAAAFAASHGSMTEKATGRACTTACSTPRTGRWADG